MNRIDRPVAIQRAIDRAVRTAKIGDRVITDATSFRVVQPGNGELFVVARREHMGGTTGPDRMLFAWQIAEFIEGDGPQRRMF